MPQNENMLNAAIALTRFGMGARPGEIDVVVADPRGWLEARSEPPARRRRKGSFRRPPIACRLILVTARMARSAA